jgi:hypothetical protein
LRQRAIIEGRIEIRIEMRQSAYPPVYFEVHSGRGELSGCLQKQTIR